VAFGFEVLGPGDEEARAGDVDVIEAVVDGAAGLARRPQGGLTTSSGD